MAKSNDVVALATAGLNGDRSQVLRICRSIMQRDKESTGLKVQLDKLLNRHNSNPHNKFTLNDNLLPSSLKGLVVHCEPTKRIADLVLPPDVDNGLFKFLNERRNIEKLHSFNLNASSRVLLSGPPGNGKTSLAEAIANELSLPFFTLDFSTIISSHLGESGSKIATAFRAASNSPCVLIIDEMETVLSERSGKDNRHDVGEVARIVSTLLQEIDRLSDLVVLIGATNHLEMLDRAVVRRFDCRWELGMPTESQKAKWLKNCENEYPKIPVASFDIDTEGLSMSDLEKLVLSHCKDWALESIA
ncbi:ATP-binding protein [Vibrio parahaemolyticus]|nr:ATP-binding protein [Vibrio parahaemolyticus]